MYFKKLLQLFAAPGDDGNYASTAASDLVCLQVKVHVNFVRCSAMLLLKLKISWLLMIIWILVQSHLLLLLLLFFFFFFNIL